MMKPPADPTEKVESLKQRYDQWGQLLRHIDDMYRSSNDDKTIRESIRKQVYKDVLDHHQYQASQHHQSLQQTKKAEDAKMLEYWKQEGERLDRIEQERKRKLKEANDFNKRQVEQVITSTGPVVSEQPYMFGSVYEREREKRRAFEKEMMQFYQQQQNMKRQQRSASLRNDLLESKRKHLQAQQIEHRRKLQLQRISEQHKQNMQVYNHVGAIMQDREKQQEQLIKNIVVDGGLKNEMKLLDQYREGMVREHESKKAFVKELQRQLETDQFRDLKVGQLEKQYEKAVVDNTVALYQRIEAYKQNERKMQNRQLANTLIQQQHEKRRRELYDKNMDRTQARLNQSLIYNSAPSDQLASPVHVGKVPYEDRLKQMSQIDRNLYQSLLLNGGGQRLSSRDSHLASRQYYRSGSQQSNYSQRSRPEPYNVNPENPTFKNLGSSIVSGKQTS